MAKTTSVSKWCVCELNAKKNWGSEEALLGIKGPSRGFRGGKTPTKIFEVLDDFTLPQNNFELNENIPLLNVKEVIASRNHNIFLNKARIVHLKIECLYCKKAATC